MFKDSIMYSSEGIHGDQIELVRGNDGFYAEAWNDGYPNRMGGGGYGCRIPDSLIIRFSVFKFDQWLRENGQLIREERDVRAVYEAMTSGVYEVRMSVRERDVTILEVKLSVPDAATASAVADKWKEKNTDIYQYLIEKLF